MTSDTTVTTRYHFRNLTSFHPFLCIIITIWTTATTITTFTPLAIETLGRKIVNNHVNYMISSPPNQRDLIEFLTIDKMLVISYSTGTVNHAFPKTETVKSPIKDTPKPPNKGQTKSTLVLYTLHKITSERGQPLYKGQNAGSQACPLFRG